MVPPELRVFIAIDIEDNTVLSNLVRARDLLLESGADLKPVETENLHLTIRFIGETPLKIVNDICRELSKLEFAPFKIHVKGIGVFPSIARPRVIWAGVSEGSDKLVEIHDKVEEILSKLGIPGEREKFVPHITLARVRSPRNLSKLVKIINNMIDMDFGEYTVTHIVLKRSTLTPSGPIYNDVCSVKAKQ
ncbi:MAG: RNA 2',3'-cyclic phosphodiesterase [Thermoprotei archaeon]